MIDFTSAATDTPGCAGGQVFLDSAGSSLPPHPVLDTVVAHLHREAEVGGYRAAQERAEELEDGYTVFADVLGCSPEEVAFSDSATRSWLSAFQAIPLTEGDRVLITEIEYAGNAIPILRRAQAVGASVEVVPSTASGEVSLPALRELLDERVKLLSLVHAPTNGGLLTSVKKATAAAHEVGALVLLDACQSVGQVECRAGELGVDFITGTGRKWVRGPRGTGFLYVKRAVLETLVKENVDLRGGSWTARDRVRLREDAKVFELWEYGVADRLGLVAAGRYMLELGIPEIYSAVQSIGERLREGLARIDGVRVHDLGERRSGIVTFSVEGIPATEVVELLGRRNVTTTVSRRPSTLIDMSRRGLEEIVRASPHYFVSPQQVDTTLEAVQDIRGGRTPAR